MAGGRPTEYETVKIAKAVERYIGNCKEQFYLPTVEGLAVELGVGRKTLYRWAEAHDEFRHTLDVLLTLQGSMLIQNGLKNEYNSTITKLMLSSNHDYKERQDVTSDNKAVQPLLVRFLEDDSPDSGHTEGV